MTATSMACLCLRLLCIVTITGFVSGCHPALSFKTRFDAIGEYDGASSARPILGSPDEIRLFYESSPGGFSLKENELKVERGHNHEILGFIQVMYGYGFIDSGDADKKTIIRELKKRAFSEGANAVIYVQSVLPENASAHDRLRVAWRRPWGTGWAVVLGNP